MTFETHPARDDVSIVLAGEAGSGIQTIESVLTRAFRLEGFHVFASKEYMSRVRGGSNSTVIRIGCREVRAWTDRIDLCIPLGAQALAHLESRIGPGTLVLGDKTAMNVDHPIIDTCLTAMAREAGGPIFANTIAAGIIWGAFELTLELLNRAIKHQFSGKAPEVLQTILTSAQKGYGKGLELRHSGAIPIVLPGKPESVHSLFMTGAEAVGIGSLSGGCNFVSSYPMSPSTGVLTFLAGHAHDFGVALEQAEDEISAANMVLGAWYAGARGLATTSGGGFSLMAETLSLGGMIETPMVIHLAQRPGPATGLPTRTEQGDLDLALYAGHGEFPRLILAPGNIEQAFSLARMAFDRADAWQVPTIILTDQYLMDSCYDVKEFELSDHHPKPAIIETTTDYRRYAVTEDGISPRGIPGWGTGLVGVDSDEHDEQAHITESPHVRRRMVEKRMKKFAAIAREALPPDLYGPATASHLIICWGSTLEAAREAVKRIDSPDVAILHFTQLFPLPVAARELVECAPQLILIEGNATGQFGRLLRSEWDIEWAHRILKYDGFPFAVEELQTSLEFVLEREVQP
ncbi:MAG TPA: 2-oxoacid:acceptor oxidoreductase subunit alpha [Candidatus Ozemobacteraceae bacterium]|nr:2-oxoacid:acceptor oxidoreductase subunit alpha [Candidatus Ozemobacteraceae bacterium]